MANYSRFDSPKVESTSLFPNQGDVLPWLFEKLRSSGQAVERSGAAHGLSEVGLLDAQGNRDKSIAASNFLKNCHLVWNMWNWLLLWNTDWAYTLRFWWRRVQTALKCTLSDRDGFSCISALLCWFCCPSFAQILQTVLHSVAFRIQVFAFQCWGCCQTSSPMPATRTQPLGRERRIRLVGLGSAFGEQEADPEAREGYMGLFCYLPVAMGNTFEPLMQHHSAWISQC